jgi:hypothetical protein
MATTVISCPGAGKPWNTEETNPRCPDCLLDNTPAELNIKVTRRNNKLNPSTLPVHDIEVPGTELRFTLVNSVFEVHSSTCPQIKRDLQQSDYDKPGILVATSPTDAIIQLWDDQIRETTTDPTEITEDFLSSNSFTQATNFHSRCLNKVPEFSTSSKSKSSNTQGKRDAKHALANLCIEALARTLDNILDTNIATSDPNTINQRTVRQGMSNEEIKRCASHWVHHLPADPSFWIATGFPVPDRSDWRDKATDKATNTTQTTTDTEETDDA